MVFLKRQNFIDTDKCWRDRMTRGNNEEYTILLFRNNLRIKDNHALNKAIGLGLPVLCLYCLDTQDWDRVWPRGNYSGTIGFLNPPNVTNLANRFYSYIQIIFVHSGKTIKITKISKLFWLISVSISFDSIYFSLFFRSENDMRS